MKPPGHHRFAKRDAGFTLIEVVLAAAILGILSLTVFQFTKVTVDMTGVSARESAQTQACDGFRRLLETQLGSLPMNQNGSLIGIKIDLKNGGKRDALQLVCPAGNALLTPDAKGWYEITLTLRELPRGSGHYCLGMERTPWEDDDADDDDDDDNGTRKTDVKKQKEVLPSDWITLIEGVKSLQISYFDARLDSYVEDKWPDSNTLPSLVRVRLTLNDNQPPYEIVERVPGGAADSHATPNFDTTAVPHAVNNGPPAGRVQKPRAADNDAD